MGLNAVFNIASCCIHMNSKCKHAHCSDEVLICDLPPELLREECPLGSQAAWGDLCNLGNGSTGRRIPDNPFSDLEYHEQPTIKGWRRFNGQDQIIERKPARVIRVKEIEDNE